MQQPSSPPSGASRRLTRSSRDRMWAGVAGGLAEYFDVDPVLMRLIWVAAAIVSGGLAIPVYIVLWIVMPRDDQVGEIPRGERLRSWSREIETETRRFAEEAGRMARDVTEEVKSPSSGASAERGAEAGPTWASVPESGAATTAPPSASSVEGAATDKGALTPPSPPPPPPPAWDVPRYVDPDRAARRQRAAGIVLVVLGLLFFAQQAGLFRLNWNLFWPLVLVAIGVALLVRRADWR